MDALHIAELERELARARVEALEKASWRLNNLNSLRLAYLPFLSSAFVGVCCGVLRSY